MFMESFWRRYPALLYGLACLLSCFLALKPTWLICLPIFLLFGPLFFVPIGHPLARRLTLALGLFLALTLSIYGRYDFPNLPEEGLEGRAHFHIETVTHARHAFGRQWIYKGTLEHFAPDKPCSGCVARAIPCRIILSDKAEIFRPPADRDYFVRGSLKPLIRGGYLLKMAANDPWNPVEGSFSLAEKRFRAKAALCKIIHQHILDPKSRLFLAGIVTGEFDDRLMQHELGRFGLQHIMAISGFHFSIIATIFNFILRLILSRKAATMALIAILTGYFLFLGNSPSILRAWMACMAVLGGSLLERQGSGVNSLGLALMAVLILDPLLCLHIGFQYSFAATAAILLLYSECDQLLQQLWVKRSLKEAQQMDRFNQHGLLLLTFFRQGVALSLAVNLVTMPMVLYHFHKFPWMSFLYNLFFPAMVSVSMLLLIVGLVFGTLLAPLGDWVHGLNSAYTRFMLDFTYNMPPSLDRYLRVEDFPVEILLLYLSLVALYCVKKFAPERFL